MATFNAEEKQLIANAKAARATMARLFGPNFGATAKERNDLLWQVMALDPDTREGELLRSRAVADEIFDCPPGSDNTVPVDNVLDIHDALYGEDFGDYDDDDDDYDDDDDEEEDEDHD